MKRNFKWFLRRGGFARGLNADELEDESGNKILKLPRTSPKLRFGLSCHEEEGSLELLFCCLSSKYLRRNAVMRLKDERGPWWGCTTGH